jgi:NADH-quinone oxidoreductase subunit J
MGVELVFYILAIFAVLSAVLCVSQKNAIASALWLVSTMFSLAAIYVLLNAQFIAAIQVLVYAGAVMVLFLFVIMLLNIGRGPSDLRGMPVRIVAALIGAALLAQLLVLARVTPGGLALAQGVAGGSSSPLDAFPAGRLAATAPAAQGVVGAIAEPLFRTYLVPFELTSILLLAAAVGAVVLAKRKL